MSDAGGPDWAALRRAYRCQPYGQGGAAQPCPLPSAADPKALGATCEDQVLARDLAEERAAIMVFDGGLSRAKAEALAWREHGLKPVKGS